MRKLVSYVGLSRNKLYHNPRPRVIQIDPTVTKTVRKTGLRRPTYGTRRMAASVSWELGVLPSTCSKSVCMQTVSFRGVHFKYVQS